MGKYENDTRKATIDLQEFLGREEIPAVHIITRTFLLRYGFGKKKVLSILRDAFPNFEYDEATDEIKRVA